MRRALLVAFGLALALASHAAAAGSVDRGRDLYFAHCAWCHGDRLQGVPLTGRSAGPGGELAGGPPLSGVGTAAADFYLRTGYMPLRDPKQPPKRTRPSFTSREIANLVAFVGSHGGQPPPRVRPERGSLAVGLQVFTEHCAGCHQITGEGGIVTDARVPPLGQASAEEIAEAVRVGPYVMPSFDEREIDQHELDSLARYVLYTKNPDDRGGWGISHLGPVPEGIVAWLLAGAALLVVARLIGEGLRR